MTAEAVALVELLRLSRGLRRARQARAEHRAGPAGVTAPPSVPSLPQPPPASAAPTAAAPTAAAEPAAGGAWKVGDRVRIVSRGPIARSWGPESAENKFAGRVGVLHRLPALFTEYVYVLLDLKPRERKAKRVFLLKTALEPEGTREPAAPPSRAQPRSSRPPLPPAPPSTLAAPVSVPAPSSRPEDFRAATLRILGPREPWGDHKMFYQIEAAKRARLAEIGGFDRDEWKVDQFNTTPLVFGRLTDLERVRDTFARELPEAKVELNDYPTREWAFGRTSAPEDRDLPRLVTRTLVQGHRRTVAVKRTALGWQVARWAGSWTPFESKDATPVDHFSVDAGGRIRHLSDGTWVVFGSHLNAYDLDGLSIHTSLPSALAWAEHRHARASASWRTIPLDAPTPPAPAGVPASARSVVGWRDGGPVVELRVTLPKGYAEEVALVVRGWVPSGARRMKGETWRQIEKVVLEVSKDGKPMPRYSYDGERTLQRLVYDTIEALPDAERARAQGMRTARLPAPFQVGDVVRYVSTGAGGPDRFGLVAGTVGVVEHIRRPRDAKGDQSEVVFGNHVEVVEAGTKLFERVEGDAASAALAPEGLPEGLTRSNLRRLATELRDSIGRSTRWVGQYEEDKLGEKASERRRTLWQQERMLRLVEVALEALPEEAPAPPPAPLPVPDNIEELREEFAARRERRIEGLRHAGERRVDQGARRQEAGMSLLREIPLGQPNIVDTSAGRAFARQRAKWHAQVESGWALIKEGETFLRRAEAAENNSAISSDDPDAIEKLLALAAEREQTQDWMKRVNTAARAGDRAQLAELGLSEERIARTLTPDSAGRVGFAPWALSNNHAQIKRLRERAAELTERRRAGPKAPEQYGAIEISEEDNRVRIHFPADPGEPHKTWLHGHGFKWARSLGVWQRHPSPTAWAYAREIAERLGGPRVRQEGTEEASAANEAGLSALAALALDNITRTARRSDHGVADVGEAVEEVRTFSGKDRAEVHAALAELEDAGQIELRAWGPYPPSRHKLHLAPEGPGGAHRAWARPLGEYAGNRHDPIVGYKLVVTMEVDHPELREATLPKVAVGHRYDWLEFYPAEHHQHALRRIEELRSGKRTQDDHSAEYVAEVGLFVVTRDHRWAGWSVVPWPRQRPEVAG